MEKFTESTIRYTTACRVCKNRSSDLCVGDFDLKHFDPDFKIPVFLLPKLTMEDYRELPGLEVRPPDVWRYFVRVKAEALSRFAAEHGLEALEARALEDEFVYQNSFRLNTSFYASLGEKRAFMLSPGPWSGGAGGRSRRGRPGPAASNTPPPVRRNPRSSGPKGRARG